MEIVLSTVSYYKDDHSKFRTLILDYIETIIEDYNLFDSHEELKVKKEDNLNEYYKK